MSHLTIVGDRQTGRTEALLHLAIADAAAGRSVLYSGPNRVAAGDSFQRAVGMVGVRGDVKTVVERIERTNGKEAIYFCTGGKLLFVANVALRGVVVDTHAIDSETVEPLPFASRIIRTARR